MMFMNIDLLIIIQLASFLIDMLKRKKIIVFSVTEL